MGDQQIGIEPKNDFEITGIELAIEFELNNRPLIFNIAHLKKATALQAAQIDKLTKSEAVLIDHIEELKSRIKTLEAAVDEAAQVVRHLTADEVPTLSPAARAIAEQGSGIVQAEGINPP